MKKIIVVLCLFLISETLYGQGLQVGLRTGAGINFNAYETIQRKDPNWVNQLAIRYETKKKFAFELGFEHNYTAFNHTPVDYGRVYFESQFGPQSTQELSRRVQINRLALNFVAQYDITCPALQQKCPVLKRFKNYIGIQISPNNVIYTEDSRTIELPDNNTISNNRSRYSYFDVSLGISNTMKYSVSSKVDLVAYISALVSTDIFYNNLGYKVNPWLYRANAMFNNTIGLTYYFSRN